MFFTLWMVMPQTQGATYLYLHYLHPTISMHERDLDRLILHLHTQIKSKGGPYVEMAFSWFYQFLFGPAQHVAENYMNSDQAGNPRDSAPVTSESYVSALFSRFRTTPIGMDGIPSSFLSFLNMNVRHAGDIIPAHLSHEERVHYVNQQKAKVQEWLHMLDAAAKSFPAGDQNSRPTSRSSSRRPSAQQSPAGLTHRAPPGARTPTTVDSDYEDLGKEENLQQPSKSAPQPQRSASWFWKNRTD